MLPGTGVNCWNPVGGLRVLRAAGRDSAAEIPLGGLTALCRPLAGWLNKLSPARAETLAAALGVGVRRGTPDRFATYAAALTLITVAAAEAPLLLVLDDAHWLDDASAEAIAFIAQRLSADGMALLIATEADDDFPDLPELRLPGLDRPAARALLQARFGDGLAPDLADLIVEVAGGNPLALLELPLSLTAAERAGDAPVGDRLPASAEWAFLRRIEALSPDARRALIVAALAGDDRVEFLDGACRAAGTQFDLAAAEAAGLLRQEEGRVVFRHGLARTAVAYSALRTERLAAHAALATTTAGEVRAWHMARASAGLDEGVAADMETVGCNARDLRAYGVAARAFELAALTRAPPGCSRPPSQPTGRVMSTPRSTICTPGSDVPWDRSGVPRSNTYAAACWRGADRRSVRVMRWRPHRPGTSGPIRREQPRCSPTPCCQRFGLALQSRRARSQGAPCGWPPVRAARWNSRRR